MYTPFAPTSVLDVDSELKYAVILICVCLLNGDFKLPFAHVILTLI